jgi:hypothetical protein
MSEYLIRASQNAQEKREGRPFYYFSCFLTDGSAHFVRDLNQASIFESVTHARDVCNYDGIRAVVVKRNQ